MALFYPTPATGEVISSTYLGHLNLSLLALLVSPILSVGELTPSGPFRSACVRSITLSTTCQRPLLLQAQPRFKGYPLGSSHFAVTMTDVPTGILSP